MEERLMNVESKPEYRWVDGMIKKEPPRMAVNHINNIDTQNGYHWNGQIGSVSNASSGNWNWFNPETKEEREAKVYSRSMKESLDGLHAFQQRGVKQYGRNSNRNSAGNGQDNCTE